MKKLRSDDYKGLALPWTMRDESNKRIYKAQAFCFCFESICIS